MWMPVTKRPWVFVCVCCVCVCYGEDLCETVMLVPWGRLCHRPTVSAVCLRVCVCVRVIMYACKKKIMGDCVSLLCPVCWDNVCEFARVGPSVDASARDLV